MQIDKEHLNPISPKVRIGIIGSGIAGLVAAIDLASNGYEVSVFEKNNSIGGRAREFQELGFKFDMGPSWYWMPDIFESFFQKHGRSTKDYFSLIRIDPSYRIFFQDKSIDSSADFELVCQKFEELETGSSRFLRKFIEEARYKYEVGMNDFVRKPSLSIKEFLDWRLFKSVFKLQMIRSIESVIDKHILHPQLRSWLKFPVLFLGAKPKNTPALYSLMNYADFQLGTWYPEGGMFKLFDALHQLALEKNVCFHLEEAVESIQVQGNSLSGLITKKGTYAMDYVVAACDYHHTEFQLLPIEYRQFGQTYWNNRMMAPSALVFYLGLNQKIDGLLHHNLFFDEDFETHASEIYDTKIWPTNPLFYVCVTSKTDATVAPPGMENVFILVPLAAGLDDSPDERERLYKMVMARMNKKLNISVDDKVIFKKDFCLNDFVSEYNSYKGNAYGLANILTQTAFLKPPIQHKKIKNLMYAGQLTHPGPGLPPSLISAEISATLIKKQIEQTV